MDRVVGGLVEKSEHDAAVVETEQMIAEIKAFILKEVGEKIATNAMAALFVASKAGNLKEVAREQLKMKHTAYLIAQAAEAIMRRMWLG
jgi:thymidylate kinase